MAVPKRKTSKARRDKRRSANMKMTAPENRMSPGRIFSVISATRSTRTTMVVNIAYPDMEVLDWEWVHGTGATLQDYPAVISPILFACMAVICRPSPGNMGSTGPGGCIATEHRRAAQHWHLLPDRWHARRQYPTPWWEHNGDNSRPCLLPQDRT